MIYTLPTRRGLGVELWGSYDDLKCLYEVVGKFWNQENFKNDKDFENRDKAINAFSYEIRKCFQGGRLIRDESPFSLEPIKYFGVQLSWVHILFSLSALRYNTRLIESNKFDLSVFLQLEFWLEKSMNEFDAIGAKSLIPFISGGIFSGNPYLYQFLRNIDANYFTLGGGKTAFRKLPALMNKAVLNHKEYIDYLVFLNKEATRLECSIYDLEISDDDIKYDEIIW